MVKEKGRRPSLPLRAPTRRRFDPSAQTEDLSGDAVLASNLGIENLKRITPKIVEWMSEDGKYFDNVEEVYDNVMGQLRRYTGHVASNVGGVHEWQRTAEENKPVFTVVAADKQRAAVVDFVNKQIFTTPEWLIRSDILDRIGPSGVADKIEGLQSTALRTLMNTRSPQPPGRAESPRRERIRADGPDERNPPGRIHGRQHQLQLRPRPTS